MSIFKKRDKKTQKLEILQNENEIIDEEQENLINNKRFRQETDHKKSNNLTFSVILS